MKMPNKIWAGYLGGGKIWGEWTQDTNKENAVYIRYSKPTVPLSDVLAILHDIGLKVTCEEDCIWIHEILFTIKEKYGDKNE